MLSPVSASSATEKGSGSAGDSTSSSRTVISTAPVSIDLLTVSSERSLTSPRDADHRLAGDPRPR